jgi:uncharacterized protein YkwD
LNTTSSCTGVFRAPLNLSVIVLACGLVLSGCGGSSTEEGNSDVLLSSAGVSEEVAAASDAVSLSASRAMTGDIMLLAASSVVAGASLASAAPAATVTGAAVAPVVAVAADPATSCALANFQTDLMARINQARAVSRTCGAKLYNPAPPLKWHVNLAAAAAGHSADMARNNYFSHTSLDGRSAGQRITAAGYKWRGYGENIAAGQATVDIVMNGWLASAGHCANIMNPAQVDVGVSCVKGAAGSTYRTYWTMELGRN